MKFKGWLRLANAARLRVYLLAAWKVFRHPATPWPAKGLAVLLVAYAVSPIDLIPDFIPVLGQLDDLVLIPLGLALMIKLVPGPVWADCLAQAQGGAEALPRLWWGAVAIVLIWVAIALLMGAWLLRLAGRSL